ncbi:MAG TPA: hypothetical protein VG755_28170 [Nannocystaceae bacterium]|nr:hypothetical protein [Nannocystaceae bacterium]
MRGVLPILFVLACDRPDPVPEPEITGAPIATQEPSAKTDTPEALPDGAVSKSRDTHPLPDLVGEGALGLARVVNPAAVHVVGIDAAGAVTCNEKRSEKNAPQDACRDPRIALRWNDRTTHAFQDAVHQISGPTQTNARVDLLARNKVARSFNVSASNQPKGCGSKGTVLAQTHLTLDITCAGDTAVVRWAIWRAFLTRECDAGERRTRAIGPDLRCPMAKDDEHAEVAEAGIVQIDLATGAAEAIELQRG